MKKFIIQSKRVRACITGLGFLSPIEVKKMQRKLVSDTLKSKPSVTLDKGTQVGKFSSVSGYSKGINSGGQYELF
jgi:hypothetical protein